MKLFITCGYNNSLETVGLIQSLVDKKIPIYGVLITKAFNIARIRMYVRQLKPSGFYRKFKDKIVSRYLSVKRSEESLILETYLKERGMKLIPVSSYCKQNDIPYRFVTSLNSYPSREYIKESDLVVYSGGGLIRKEFLKIPSVGVLNCHSGPLPAIRGMNVLEWSLLLGIPPANTLHLIDEGVDTGDIIEMIPKKYPLDEGISHLRGKNHIDFIEDMTYGVEKILAGDYNRTPQNIKEGKQYYIMHPMLRSIAESRYRTRSYVE
ncbi:MAG: formyltransferase family protein [Balneolales bacterium]